MRNHRILLILLALAGCTDTGPIKIGKDTYTISTRVPFGSPASAKGQAEQEANAFCESHDREMLLNHVTSFECALHGGCGEAEIEFFCLKPDDPQYTRLRDRSEPNVKVEVEHEGEHD